MAPRSPQQTGGGKTPGSGSAAASGAKDASQPLTQLAQRLGALEQSLTVVASEIGVSGLPQFKHLDPEQVYGEAERRARQAFEQAAETRDERIAKVSAQSSALADRLTRDLESLGEQLDATQDSIEALQLRAKDQQATAATVADLDRRLGEMEKELRGLRAAQATALDTLRERLDTLERQNRAAPPMATVDAALERRLDVLEARLATTAGKAIESSGDWPFGSEPASPPAPQPSPDPLLMQREIEAVLERQLARALAELETRLIRRLEERATAPDAPPPSDPFAQRPPVAAADIAGLREAVASQLAEALAQRAACGDPVPLFADPPANSAGPLVMNAVERAIVRLTHRIEKLENGQEQGGGRSPSPRLGSRAGRSLMGRLFES